MTGYRLKITIKGSKPPVWRRIIIPDDYTFAQLHEAIRILFGWRRMDAYEFYIPSDYIKILGSSHELSKPGRFQTIRTSEDMLYMHLKEEMRFTLQRENQDYMVTIQVEEETLLLYHKVILMKWKGENPDTDDFMEFDMDDVQDMLIAVDELYTLFPDLSEDLNEELNDAVMNLHDLLNQFQMRDLSLIITDTKDSRETIAVSSMSKGINIQIFDNETEFLRSVENVSPYMEFNLYANSYSVLMMDDPIIDGNLTGWISEDNHCMVKKLRTGYLPGDVNNEEAQEIIRVVRNLHQMLHKAGHKTLPSMAEGHMMLGTWNQGSIDVTYPEIKLIGSTDGIRLGERQIKNLSARPMFPEEVYIDLITCPSDNFMVNNHMDVLFIIECNKFTITHRVDRKYFKDFLSLNEAVLMQLCSFIEQYGRMKRIMVNNDNLHNMVEGFCEDLHIPLQLDEFITDVQRELLGTELEDEEDDVDELLKHLSQLDEQEFLRFIEELDEDKIVEISQMISKYVFEEDDEDDFPPRLPQKKVFDA